MRTLKPWALVGLTALVVTFVPDPGGAVGQDARVGQIRGAGEPPADGPGFAVRELNEERQTVVVVDSTGDARSLSRYEKVGPWTLMAVLNDAAELLAVFEDTGDRRGDLLFVSNLGVSVALGKSLERTSLPDDSLYGGHTREEIVESPTDILGEEILAEDGDPSFERVARLLPPLRVPTFVGTNASIDKPTFDYGAFSDEIYVDVGKVYPEIAEARARLDVWEGLIGGWLPVPRWVFPSGSDRYWDLTIFADEDTANLFTQPIWFRILLIEQGRVKEAHYFYHHLPLPPQGEPDAVEFYRALLKTHREWQKRLVPTFRLDVPDERIEDFCLHALAMEMITRVGDHPKYGYPPLGGIDVFGGYGYSNVDTFQDVFNTSVNTFLEWGLFDIVRGYIDFYFTNYVRVDGSIDTRGNETGQSGYMLAALAKYYRYTGDEALIEKHRTKIEGMIAVFDWMRAESKKVSPDDPSYGILRGWSEHDSSLRNDPYSLILPFFGNSAGAIRGFTDLGLVFQDIGRIGQDAALEAEGARMVREAEAMKEDLYAGIRKTIRTDMDPPYLPHSAGDVSSMWRSRGHSEMLQSGVLTKDMAAAINRFHADGGRRLVTRGSFLNYGYGYGTIQYDWVREYLLSYYSIMAHGYSPGTWTSVESAALDMSRYAPYATPAQLQIPILTRWMFVFEDPDEPVLWLAKGTPRQWLEEGRKIAIDGAPTRFGMVGYALRSEIGEGRVYGTVDLPSGPSRPTVNLRVRVPGDRRMRSVSVNGEAWYDFDPELAIVVLPPTIEGRVSIEVSY